MLINSLAKTGGRLLPKAFRKLLHAEVNGANQLCGVGSGAVQLGRYDAPCRKSYDCFPASVATTASAESCQSFAVAFFCAEELPRFFLGLGAGASGLNRMASWRCSGAR